MTGPTMDDRRGAYYLRQHVNRCERLEVQPQEKAALEYAVERLEPILGVTPPDEPTMRRVWRIVEQAGLELDLDERMAERISAFFVGAWMIGRGAPDEDVDAMLAAPVQRAHVHVVPPPPLPEGVAELTVKHATVTQADALLQDFVGLRKVLPDELRLHPNREQELKANAELWQTELVHVPASDGSGERRFSHWTYRGVRVRAVKTMPEHRMEAAALAGPSLFSQR